MTTTAIPVIDLDATTPDELVDHLRTSACVIVRRGHGVPDDLWRSTIEASRRFFALDESSKAASRWSGDGPWLGWLPVGATDPPGTQPKLLEKFEVQLDNPWRGDPADVVDRGSSFGLWPDEPSDFRDTWTRMFTILGALAHRVMNMLIDGLGLPEADREAWTTHHFANLVVNNYIAQAVPVGDSQTRLPGHVDIGGVTLLSADEAPGGLEVCIGDEWVPVVLAPNTYLIQVGDLLRRWTDNVIPGNLHRVVNPPPQSAATSQRLSLVYFHYPAEDTVVVPVPTTVRAEVATRPALTSRDHMLQRQYREQHEGSWDDEYV